MKKGEPVAVTTQTERALNGCMAVIGFVFFAAFVVGCIMAGWEKVFG